MKIQATDTVTTALKLVPNHQVLTVYNKSRGAKSADGKLCFNHFMAGYASQNFSTAVVVDLKMIKLSDALRYDGVKERFFVATDATWVNLANNHVAHLVFLNVDKVVDNEDLFLLDRIIAAYHTKYGIKSPFNDSVKIIMTHDTQLDSSFFSNASNDKLFGVTI